MAIYFSDKNIGRLDVAMDDRLVMRMLHALANVHEEFEALTSAETVIVAIFRDGNAGDVLHYEVRNTRDCGTRVENFGDGRMVHQRQRLALGLEAGDDFARVHTRFDQLDGNAAADRNFLFCEPDLAHTAYADPLHEPVIADDGAGSFPRIQVARGFDAVACQSLFGVGMFVGTQS